MTKIKNTKKGMAKKTLSISLAVAMLATSNVPVWAAEFTDGSDAAFTSEAVVETPVEEVVTDAPVVEEEIAEDAKTTPDGDYTDSSVEVNTARYNVSNVKFTASAWGSKTAVSGTVTAGNVDVTGLQYTWLVTEEDGTQHQAAGNGAVGTATGAVNTISYSPVKADFNKELSLVIYENDSEGATIFKKVIKGGKVQPKEITGSETEAPTFDTVIYNGKEQKELPSNADIFKWTNYEGVTINADQMAWHYETPGHDFTNVTDKDITVIGELSGTYDETSTAYGYTYKTKPGTYKISPLHINAKNTKLVLNKTSVPYIGAKHTFKLADVTLYAEVDEKTRVDITKGFKAETSFVGSATAVGKNNKVSFAMKSLTPYKGTTDEAKKFLKNFNTEGWGDGVVTSENSYEITVLDLAQCTGTIKEYTVDDWNKVMKHTVPASDITLTTPDGIEFSANNIIDSINIATTDAAKNLTAPTELDNAIEVSYKVDTQNVSGKLGLTLRLVGKSLANAQVNVLYNNAWKTLSTSKTASQALKVPYIASAYDLETSKVFSDFRVSDGQDELKTTEYDVSYDDNKNAGIVTVTIKGSETNSSYKGSSKKFYFEIEKDEVKSEEMKLTKAGKTPSVTINPANNKDAAGYKDALGVEIKTELANKTTATLEEGKDYTVAYYYGDKAGMTEESLKKSSATNKIGNYVYAVATLAKDGNFDLAAGNTLVKSAEIVEKSISNVTITVEKDSYTYTGKEIIPNVTVKDGSSTLVRGEDYTVKVKNGVNVGTATVIIYAKKGSGYAEGSSAETTFEITPAKAEDVKVTLYRIVKDENGKDKKVYDFAYNKGRQIKPLIEKVTLDGVDVTDQFDIDYPVYGENVNSGKEAGSVTISPKDSTKNFTGTKTQLFDIKGVKLDGDLDLYYNDKTEVNKIDHTAFNKRGELYNFYYDGTAQTFADEVFDAKGQVKVSEGDDYEIKYINNTNAGTAFVAVVAKGNYEGNFNYDGYKQKTGKGYKAWKDYRVVDGKLQSVVTDSSNNVLSATTLATNVVDVIAFVVNPTYFTAKNISVVNGTYAAGKPVKPEVSVTVNGKTLVEGKDYYLTLTSINGYAHPDEFVDVTADKPYYVTVNAMGGYKFDNVNGTNKYVWGIDKKDLADCFVTVTKDGKDFDLVVMNGNVVEKKEAFDVKDNGDGTATVSVIDGGKSYTGSTTVTIVDPEETGAVGQTMIKDVKVAGNKATVVLDGEADNALGYDFVISTTADYKNGRVDVVKNQLKTVTDFTYVPAGTYYAYCHAWKRDAEGNKVFGQWSNIFKFEVSAITPSQPVIKKVTRKGNDVTVTYSTSESATGYDVVLGTKMATVTREKRPVEYGKYVKKNQKTTTVTFKNVKKGTYYVGLHAFNRTSEDGKKVFSPWSVAKKIVVK